LFLRLAGAFVFAFAAACLIRGLPRPVFCVKQQQYNITEHLRHIVGSIYSTAKKNSKQKNALAQYNKRLIVVTAIVTNNLINVVNAM